MTAREVLRALPVGATFHDTLSVAQSTYRVIEAHGIRLYRSLISGQTYSEEAWSERDTIVTITTPKEEA